MSYLIHGFELALTPTNLIASLIGVLMGTLVGVLPGLAPTGAMALILPLTVAFEPLTGLITMAGVWYGAQYGGSTTSILVNIPGEPSSVITCIDGYAMARKGRAGAALTVSAVGSFVAGTFGLILLQFFAPPMAKAALAFGPPEYLAVMIFAMVAMASLSGKSPVKTAVMLGLGISVSFVGIDPASATLRYTLGIQQFLYGIEFVPVSIGLFGVAEVLRLCLNPYEPPPMASVRLRDLYPTREEMRRSWKPIARGSIMGFFIGLMPGAPGVVASFTSYSIEKSISPYRDEFGKGAIEGVAGPESANNSAVVGGLVPLLTLGIPFGAVAAVLLAALQIHDVTPGPLMMIQHPDIFWGFVAAMYLGNVFLLVLNLPLVGLFARTALLPPRVLMPIIGVVCLIGAYAMRLALFDVWIALVGGVVGFILTRWGFGMMPLVIGMVLGPLIENNLRVTVQLVGGDFFQFLSRPITIGLLAMIPLYLIFLRYANRRGIVDDAA